MSLVLGSRVPRQKLRALNEWEKEFLTVSQHDHDQRFLRQSQSYDSWQYYSLAYGMDGYAAMYEATEKSEYLERALLYVENVINNARPSRKLGAKAFGDGYLGWTSTRGDVEGEEVPLFESYCWRYVTRLLRVMKVNGTADGSGDYQQRFKDVLAFTEMHIFDKWYSRGVDGYIYRVNTHMASHWAYIALDLWLVSADDERRQRYWTVFKNISSVGLPNHRGAHLRSQMRPHPTLADGYFWNYDWNSDGRPGSDVSHGGNTISFIVEAIDVGQDWTPADAARFIATLDRAIWKNPGEYANYVDGSGSGSGWFNEGWCKLGRYSAALQRRLEGHTVGRNTQLFGNGALNAKILETG